MKDNQCEALYTEDIRLKDWRTLKGAKSMKGEGGRQSG